MCFNPMSLAGKTILVTGASSGIGQETAVVLSKLGAAVVLVGRSAERLAATREMLDGDGHRSELYELSNSNTSEWMKSLVTEIGPLHGLVHSAGVYVMKPMRLLGNADIQKVMDINLTAGLALLRAFRQKGVYHPGGSSVVLLSSVMGLVGQPALGAYCASKGAVIALAKSVALELARDSIRVNCVAPGQLETPMAGQFTGLAPEQLDMIRASHPLGLGTPRDVAHAVAFLLGDTGRWITGSTLVVDGGYTAQ